MRKAPCGVITPRYLSELHPELTRDEVDSLYVFCWDNRIRHVDCYGSGSIMYSLWKESKLKNMNKKIEMSLETARQMYKEGNETTNKWLLENFTKEELEPKKGFTWEESFRGDGYYIKRDLDYLISPAPDRVCCAIVTSNKDVFLTEKHAKSALAFAQLSHIVNKYNEGKKFEGRYYSVSSDCNLLSILTWFGLRHHLEFYDYDDAKTSREVNRQLWLDYWMID